MRKVNVLSPRAAGTPLRAGQAVGAEQIGASVYVLADGERTAPFHFHHGGEEWLITLDGAPRVRTPDGERTLRKGDVLCFRAGAGGGHEVSGPGTVMLVAENRALDAIERPEEGTIELRPAGLVFRTADALGSEEAR